MPKSSMQHRDSFFPWLTGFLLCCGLTCLLTSYCKRQTPCDSGLKVKEGFCQGWKRTRGQIVAKGLIEVTYDSLNDRVKRWMFGPACTEVLSSMLERLWVRVCPQPFPTILFSCRLFGSILGCCSALFLVSAVLGFGALLWKHSHTLW